MADLYSYLVAFFLISLITKLVILRRHNKNSPPSPLSLPLIGHLYLLKPPLHLTLQTLSLKYGPIFSLRLGLRSFLVVSSPSSVEDCFTKNDIVLANRPRSMVGDNLSYNYSSFLLAPHGHHWRSLRKLTTIEIFSQKGLQKFSAVREEEVLSMVRHVFAVSSGGSGKVDLNYLFFLLMFNIMTRINFGKKWIGEEIASTGEAKRRVKEVRDAFFPSLSLINECDFFPFLRWVGYKGLEKKLVMLHRKRDEFLRGLIEEFRGRKTSSSNETLIEKLLSLQESEPEFYSESVVKSTAMIMYVAGPDTSANTMKWCMSLLLNHPQELQKLRNEIKNHVGHGRLLKESDIPNLPYLRCVINESLRLYPVAPLLLPHFSSEDCTVGGYHVPKGTTLLVNAWAVHRDPKVWEEPDEFKPERFEDILEGEREGFNFRYLPFGMGRRACPGAAMAIRIVSLAVGALVHCFDWERVGEELVDLNQDFGITLAKSRPLEAVSSPRPFVIDLLSQL